MTLCPSGQGDGLEIHWALPAGARIPSVSICAESVLPAACAAALRLCCPRPLVLPSCQVGVLGWALSPCSPTLCNVLRGKQAHLTLCPSG